MLLVGAALLMHGELAVVGLLPEAAGQSVMNRTFLKIDYSFFLNVVFLTAIGALGWLY